MFTDDTRRKIKNITEGIILEGSNDNCTKIRNFLCRRFKPSTTVKEDFEGQLNIKKEQVNLIEEFCNQNDLWLNTLPGKDAFLAQGGESKVYYHPDGLSVVKINDGRYYATWLEFLTSILLHNLIFENTNYSLLGFTRNERSLYAVLQQPFVTCDGQADLTDIKKFLEFNGFVNTKQQDYLLEDLGLILEDMHDENVLVFMDTLFFIDTVFYTITPTPKVIG